MSFLIALPFLLTVAFLLYYLPLPSRVSKWGPGICADKSSSRQAWGILSTHWNGSRTRQAENRRCRDLAILRPSTGLHAEWHGQQPGGGIPAVHGVLVQDTWGWGPTSFCEPAALLGPSVLGGVISLKVKAMSFDLCL